MTESEESDEERQEEEEEKEKENSEERQEIGQAISDVLGNRGSQENITKSSVMSEEPKICKDVQSLGDGEHQEEKKENQEQEEDEIGFGVFKADEFGNLVQVGFGQHRDPESSQSSSFEQLPQRGWGQGFRQSSSSFGSFHENLNPFLYPGALLTRPSLSSGRGGGSASSRGGFTPAVPSLPPQEALFSSIKKKVSLSPLIDLQLLQLDSLI